MQIYLCLIMNFLSVVMSSELNMLSLKNHWQAFGKAFIL